VSNQEKPFSKEYSQGSETSSRTEAPRQSESSVAPMSSFSGEATKGGQTINYVPTIQTPSPAAQPYGTSKPRRVKIRGKITRDGH